MATITDVAKRAGVTRSTVSNVLTGKVVVRELTKARVLAAISELNYQPNLVARGLRQAKTFILALVVPTVVNPYYAEIVETVERVAERHDYHLMLCTTGADVARGHKHLHGLANRSVDGLLIMSGGVAEGDVRELARHSIPIVLAGWEDPLPDDRLPQVSIDFQNAGEIAGRHLADLGHRSIAVISEQPAHLDRIAGFQTALSARGLTLEPEVIRAGESTFAGGYAAAKVLLARSTPPTAIFATNDLMALGALDAATDLGVRVPDALSVVGLDNIEQSEYARPPLTTVAIPRRAFAEEATELLLRCIAHPEGRIATTTLVRPHLIVRRSTGGVQPEQSSHAES